MINDIKDLKALFKLCRAQGVTDFKMQGIEIKFGDMPQPQGSIIQGEESDALTDEDLMFYSTPAGQAEIEKKIGLKS